MKLNLGACDRHFEGFVNVDIVPPADQIVDLNFPWPWADSSVEEVLAYDVIEHIDRVPMDKAKIIGRHWSAQGHVMNELWRVLKPGGIARIQVPDSSEGDGADCDLTHVSRWNRSSFEYFELSTDERNRFRNSPYYGVKADFKVVSMNRTRHERRRGGYVIEIQVVLEAVK